MTWRLETDPELVERDLVAVPRWLQAGGQAERGEHG